MELEGKIWKEKKHWLVEVPALAVMTQGRTRKEALEMIQDAIRETVHSYFKNVNKSFRIIINDYKNECISITASNDELLSSLSRIRQREARII